MYHLILGLTTALLDRQKKIVLPEDIMHIMNLMSGYMSSFSNNFVVDSKTWTGSYHQIVIKLHLYILGGEKIIIHALTLKRCMPNRGHFIYSFYSQFYGHLKLIILVIIQSLQSFYSQLIQFHSWLYSKKYSFISNYVSRALGKYSRFP